MKGKIGRPNIPLSTITNRKGDGLTGAPAFTATKGSTATLARGGSAKKRLDKKVRKGR